MTAVRLGSGLSLPFGVPLKPHEPSKRAPPITPIFSIACASSLAHHSPPTQSCATTGGVPVTSSSATSQTLRSAPHPPVVRSSDGMVLEPPGGLFDVVCDPSEGGAGIQRAIDFCPPGGTIHLAAGEYHLLDPIHINRNVHLFGRGGAVLQAYGRYSQDANSSVYGHSDSVVSITAREATLDGITLTVGGAAARNDGVSLFFLPTALEQQQRLQNTAIKMSDKTWWSVAVKVRPLQSHYRLPGDLVGTTTASRAVHLLAPESSPDSRSPRNTRSNGIAIVNCSIPGGKVGITVVGDDSDCDYAARTSNLANWPLRSLRIHGCQLSGQACYGIRIDVKQLATKGLGREGMLKLFAKRDEAGSKSGYYSGASFWSSSRRLQSQFDISLTSCNIRAAIAGVLITKETDPELFLQPTDPENGNFIAMRTCALIYERLRWTPNRDAYVIDDRPSIDLAAKD